jgi:hypothetical protein
MIRHEGHQGFNVRLGEAVTVGKPMAVQLPAKISANDSPTMARIPHRRIPWGACSRDDPHPKFLFTTRMEAPLCFGSLKGCAFACPLRIKPFVLKGVLPDVRKRHTTKIPGRHDAIGIDIVARHRHTPAFHTLDFWIEAHSISLTSVTRPLMAAAATMAGLIRSVRPVALPDDQ